MEMGMRDTGQPATFFKTLTRQSLIPCIACSLAGLALFAGCASAGAASLAGSYKGAGRDCRGLLRVQADFITWYTPFASCAMSRYGVLDQSSSKSATRGVFLLKPAAACSFAVITLEQDSAHRQYWNATGYRSKKDYRQGSNDTLLCNLTKRSQR